MILQRDIYDQLRGKVQANKVLILYGSRRTGKTVLLNEYISCLNEAEYLLLNGEDQIDLELLENRSVRNYRQLLQNKEYLIIDEAQKIPEIGLKLKLIIDNIDEIKVIATGSSVFDLSNKLGEPLVGRKYTIQLFPFSQSEFNQIEDYKTTRELLEHRLIYGSYPELMHLSTNEEKEEYLLQLVNDYLLKDILEFDGIRNSQKIYDLLRLIALRSGSEVSIENLANDIDLSKNTIDKYLDLLSKVFILYRLPGFTKNLRKEITKSDKWYFLDNGIRNALIKNFNPLDIRQDVGSLWENYLIYERLKHQSYKKITSDNYFWRTYDQQEIDWIERRNSGLNAYEFKWRKSHAKVPTAWKKNYENASFELINRDNYLQWIT